MMKHLFIFVVNAVSVLCVFSYPSYLANIPVNDVPFLCRDNFNEEYAYRTEYIGHELCDRETPKFSERNAFGIDFSSNNHNWTAICPIDSDGDGRSNGKEMGDPNCEWTPSVTLTLTAVSHPGYPETAETSNNGTRYIGDCSHINMGCLNAFK
ncbi:temptin-like [Saccostrea echinata]|uniref:temptin-like n=1 Tax=Saccostrea echinata TaxID=191078 RepID=UPI002A7EDC36|nr:temptin-like [Saccostrea echinata]